tara:strand:+ start:1012 stop:1197 length:186 start_codon:yes stop_codon:yes gene_type:complete
LSRNSREGYAKETVGVLAMRETGFEPAQALSYCRLRAARLTTPAPPHKILRKRMLKKVVDY